MNRIKNILKTILPVGVIKLLKQWQKRRKRATLKLQRKKGHIYYKQDIINGLKKSGIEIGDSLLVHCKMSSMGYIDGGEKTIINALCEAINAPEEGTLLMPTFPMNQMTEDYFSNNPVFDVINTPSSMGKVSETFRKMRGVIRSLHPSHPVCAIGPNTSYFLNDHFKQIYPFNENSPFYKLCEKKGKIILIGLKIGEALTNLHIIEDVIDEFNIPVYKEDILKVNLVDYKGVKHIVPLKIHDSKISVKRKCDDLEPIFIEANILIKSKICDAECMVIDAEKLLNKMVDLYKSGITIYNPYPSK